MKGVQWHRGESSRGQHQVKTMGNPPASELVSWLLKKSTKLLTDKLAFNSRFMMSALIQLPPGWLWSLLITQRRTNLDHGLKETSAVIGIIAACRMLWRLTSWDSFLPGVSSYDASHSIAHFVLTPGKWRSLHLSRPSSTDPVQNGLCFKLLWAVA